MIAPITETTVKVLGERRLKLIREIGTTITTNQTVFEAIQRMKSVFDVHNGYHFYTILYG